MTALLVRTLAVTAIGTPDMNIALLHMHIKLVDRVPA